MSESYKNAKYVLIVYRRDFNYCPCCGEDDKVFLKFDDVEKFIHCENCDTKFQYISIKGEYLGERKN